MKNICVYCGSSAGNRAEYTEGAKALARALVGNNLGLVYGGSNLGLMGVVAEEVLALGGTATGIIPESLVTKELAHPALSELIVTRNMHERKAMMAERSDGFIALPGGLGTFEELFEILTWAQAQLSSQACGCVECEWLLRWFALVSGSCQQRVIHSSPAPQHVDGKYLRRFASRGLQNLHRTRGGEVGLSGHAQCHAPSF